MKFWYIFASCWIFLHELYCNARIHKHQIRLNVSLDSCATHKWCGSGKNYLTHFKVSIINGSVQDLSLFPFHSADRPQSLQRSNKTDKLPPPNHFSTHLNQIWSTWKQRQHIPLKHQNKFIILYSAITCNHLPQPPSSKRENLDLFLSLAVKS
jgi:hypothetical protein